MHKGMLYFWAKIGVNLDSAYPVSELVLGARDFGLSCTDLSVLGCLVVSVFLKCLQWYPGFLLS